MNATLLNANLIANAFFDEVAQCCQRIVLSDDLHPDVVARPTDYVITGRTITLRTKNGDFPFWIGLNHRRIFFIAYVADITKELAKETYKFTFGGATQIGWSISCESLPGGVSIWGTLDGKFEEPMGVIVPQSTCDPVVELTEAGLFWAKDVAMMVQSWVRTSERSNITRHEREPAPL